MADPCAVLIVEDDGTIRAMLSDVLADEGWEVRTAANGHEALAILELWRPDLILLDLEMPEMDGITFRAEQRRRPDLSDIPVVILSAVADFGVRIVGLDATATLAKPCDLDVLARTIRMATEGDRTQLA